MDRERGSEQSNESEDAHGSSEARRIMIDSPLDHDQAPTLSASIINQHGDGGPDIAGNGGPNIYADSANRPHNSVITDSAPAEAEGSANTRMGLTSREEALSAKQFRDIKIGSNTENRLLYGDCLSSKPYRKANM